MTRISNKYPTFQAFWDEYRANYWDQLKDLTSRGLAVLILKILYDYWKNSRYEPEEGVFYGKFFGKATLDILNYARNRELYQNIFQQLKLKDPELFKSGSKVEHSKINKKSKQSPQTTEYTNIPYTPGEDMQSETYGRAQILKQQSKQLKSIERESTEGRKVTKDDGTYSFEPTYQETTSWGDKNWLGRWLNALQYLDFVFDPKTYGFLFVKLFGASGYLITLPSGRKKWVSTSLDEEDEDETPTPTKKKKQECPDLSWEEWKVYCAEQSPVIIPTQQNFYLEQITRYLKRKGKKKPPLALWLP